MLGKLRLVVSVRLECERFIVLEDGKLDNVKVYNLKSNDGGSDRNLCVCVLVCVCEPCIRGIWITAPNEL